MSLIQIMFSSFEQGKFEQLCDAFEFNLSEI